jgi:23S rRNA pseudouridine1911/1915/1917 synthase
VRLGFAPSRRAAKELIAAGRVRVNGRHLRKGESISSGDDVAVTGPPDSAALPPNSYLTLEVLFEDASVLVVNKPGRMPCHPLRPDESGTVMNAVAAAYPETAAAGDKPNEGGLVHRLDNGTSGALLIARTGAAFVAMRSAIREGRVARRYQALVAGQLENAVEIAAPIAHHPKNPRKMIAINAANAHAYGLGARPAATIVEPVASYQGFTLVTIKPRTGCRHQIRVHLASIGMPLAGDILYGGPPLAGMPPDRFWLHLGAMAFDSPSGGQVEVEAPLAPDLAAIVAELAR